jgi:16S rRNA (guanine966-N2)-methyltransferase
MRIIAGTLKSRKIQFPKTKLTRPMTDRSKETVFNILGGLVPGKRVLDLYAGSGSLGLEALSRGALDAVFVDRASWATKVIKKNLEDLHLQPKAQILETDVLRAIDKFKKNEQSYSLIFVDPPFNQGLVKKTLIKLDQSGIVLPFGQVIVGHTRQEELPLEHLETLKLARTKKIGQACLSFLFRLDSGHGETKSYLSGEL